jgi:hypothetical protein
MRLIIAIIGEYFLETMYYIYEKEPASGIKSTAMRDERGDYIEVIIGRDHPLFNYKLISDAWNQYNELQDAAENFYIELEDMLERIV